MPPHSKYLWEEGMCTKSFKLVEKGIFQEEGSIASPVYPESTLQAAYCFLRQIWLITT